MVNYANRMSQPAVQRLSQADSIGYLKEVHPIFFGFVGDLQGPLWVSGVDKKTRYIDSDPLHK